MENTNTNLIYLNITKEELNNLYLEQKYYINSISYRVLKESKCNLEYEDLKSEAAIIFLSIIKKYDISFNTKLSTFIFNNIYFYLKMYIRDNFFDSNYNNVNCDINDMNLQNESDKINELIYEDNNKKTIEKIQSVLCKKQLKYFNKILEDEYCEDRKLQTSEYKQIFKSIKKEVRRNNIEYI